MFDVGQLVRVLPPFGVTHNGVYPVVEVAEVDGAPVYRLDGIEGFFARHFLVEA